MQPLLKFLLTLLFAHLLGDFPLQSSGMVRSKKHGIRAYLRHGIIHLIVLTTCVALFVGPNLATSVWFWIAACVYIAAHLGIDRAKQGLLAGGKLPDSASVFLLDQVVHVATMIVFAWLMIRPRTADLRSQVSLSAAAGDRILEAGTVYVAVLFGGGYLIPYLTRRFASRVKKPGESAREVENIGMYIGWLERFLVITAILCQSASMVGLILTGKSIARFPELKETAPSGGGESHFAEYFLVGTLLSISLAVLGGLVLAKLWYGTISLK